MHVYLNVIFLFLLAAVNQSHAFAVPKVGIAQWEHVPRENQHVHYQREQPKLVARARELRRLHVFSADDVRPMSAEDSAIITRSFQIARQLGLAMLQLEPNDPRYQRGFGDFTGELHTVVMQNVRRFVNLLDRATPAELGSPLTADDNVTEDFIVSRRRLPLDNGRRPVAEVVDRVIFFDDDFFDNTAATGFFTDHFPLVATLEERADPAYLTRAAGLTRAATVFHEMMHFVSRGRMQPVFDAAVRAGAQITPLMDADGNTRNPRTGVAYGAWWNPTIRHIVDVPLNGMLANPGTPQRQDDGVYTFEIAPDAVAYTTAIVGRMAMMTYGRYMAALNAESYTLVAITALLNIPGDVFSRAIARTYQPPATANANHIQVSIMTGSIEDDHSALFADLKKSPDTSFLAWLFGFERLSPDALTGLHQLPA